ncbi:DUF2304 family protein [Chloroflexota bacterium]
MAIATILFTDTLGIVATLVILHLLRRRSMTIGLGLSWFLVVGGLMTVVSVPGLNTTWIRLSSIFFESPPYIIALMLFLLAFLLHQSVVISVLQRQVREIGQFIALSGIRPEDDDVSYAE